MKKKCLLILPRNIFPVVGGYAIKNYNLIQILNRYFLLKLVVLSEDKFSNDEILFYKSNSSEFYCFPFSKWNYKWNALCTLFSLKPIQVGYYSFSKVKNKINTLFADCDIVIGALIRTVAYTEHAPKSVVRVFDMVDSIGLNYIHSQNEVKSLFWKILYKIEAGRLMKYEQKWVERSDVTYLFNQNESLYWEKYGKTQWLPHGVNSKLFNYVSKDINYRHYIGFIGKMNYQPNIDAVKWYVENVHVKIGKIVPLLIIGAYPTKEIKDLARKYSGIIVTGFVDDPYLILNSVMAVIAPMQTGGGIQNKVLEAMALGKINILSSLAANPIVGGENMKHFIIADAPQDYVASIMDLKNEPEKYNSIGVQARLHIQKYFTWERYEQEYIKGINSFFK